VVVVVVNVLPSFPLAPKDRRLLFLWLANDIVQTSKKKGNEFIKEFAKLLEPCVAFVYRYLQGAAVAVAAERVHPIKWQITACACSRVACDHTGTQMIR
jgi:nitrogenase molybdenum-iron protein alpha/beta subunit